VEVEDNGSVISEEAGPLRVVKTVGVVTRVNQLEEIDNVDTADLELREVLEQEINGSQRLMGADISTRGHDQVGILTSIGRELRPDTNTLGAVLNSSVHREVLQMLLLIGNNNVDIVDRAKTVVHDREQTVSIRRKVDADNLGTLVGNDIKEARILVSETIVVLTPDNGSQENVEGSNLGTPLNLETLLNPLAVLVDHRVNNMDERLVAVE
jgi:hypothetical protein